MRSTRCSSDGSKDWESYFSGEYSTKGNSKAEDGKTELKAHSCAFFPVVKQPPTRRGYVSECLSITTLPLWIPSNTFPFRCTMYPGACVPASRRPVDVPTELAAKFSSRCRDALLGNVFRSCRRSEPRNGREIETSSLERCFV